MVTAGFGLPILLSPLVLNPKLAMAMIDMRASWAACDPVSSHPPMRPMLASSDSAVLLGHTQQSPWPPHVTNHWLALLLLQPEVWGWQEGRDSRDACTLPRDIKLLD